MMSDTTKPDSLAACQPRWPLISLTTGLIRIESEVRARAREFIEEMIRGELDIMLARPRYGRSQIAGDEESAVVTGHRHGSRTPASDRHVRPDRDCRAARRLNTADGKTTEWKSKALRAYQRRTLAADALIASTYLAGTNTRRVRRALAALFGGAVGKDTVARVWRKVKTDWDAWNARSLADEPIVGSFSTAPWCACGSTARRLPSRCSRHRCARGRPEGIARDQEHGRRKRRGIARCPRRSHQARSATAQSSASSTARQGVQRQLPPSGTACRCRGAQYTSIATCSPLPPSACTRRSVPTSTT